MLKAAVATQAVVWAAPAVVLLRPTPALAGSAPPRPPEEPTPQPPDTEVLPNESEPDREGGVRDDEDGGGAGSGAGSGSGSGGDVAAGSGGDVAAGAENRTAGTTRTLASGGGSTEETERTGVLATTGGSPWLATTLGAGAVAAGTAALRRAKQTEPVEVERPDPSE